MPFSSPSWRSLNLSKGSLKHPKKSPGIVISIEDASSNGACFNFGLTVHCTEAIGSSQVVGISDS